MVVPPQTNGDGHQQTTQHSSKPVIIVGAGPVGLLIALRLAQAQIDSLVIEREPSTSDLPRAVGYYAASQLALEKAHVYNLIRKQGFMTPGLCWRKRPVDDGTGFKRQGEMIAKMPLVGDDSGTYPLGSGLLSLPQADLSKLLLREVLATGRVTVYFNNALVSMDENGDQVKVTTKNPQTGEESQFIGSFLAAADGAKSTTRKLLNIPFPGHTWPERLLANDVVLHNYEDTVFPTTYVMDRVNYTIFTPLTEPILGQDSLWRFTVALDPAETRPDEEILKVESIHSLFEEVMTGPRPLQCKIVRSSIYNIHQRLAATMRRGRVLLAGDAAHICNPYGAMGLNTGILDADALADALILVINEHKPLAVLDVYSDERRQVFQTFVDPTTTHNKLRVHTNDQETAVSDDWFFRTLHEPTAKVLQELARPFFEVWPTDMRKVTEELGL